jgi:hypothetical protein
MDIHIITGHLEAEKRKLLSTLRFVWRQRGSRTRFLHLLLSLILT